jgi:hypothetical protein
MASEMLFCIFPDCEVGIDPSAITIGKMMIWEVMRPGDLRHMMA